MSYNKLMDTNIKVYINKSHSGNLSYENEQYTFNYKEDSVGIVSLTMPIRKSSWDSKKLHPIFQMNMPEGALKDAIVNYFSKIEIMDDINLLKIIGPYMLGRVKFERVVDDILTSPKQNLFNELMERFAIKSGISGVQPKLLLKAHNKTTMRFEDYIIKSWEDNYPNLALNEYFCMRAVKNAGLITPDFYISNDLKLFIMKRFDIKEDGSYLGFEDMCVLTGKGTTQKYDGSYEDITRVIKDVILPQDRKETLRTLFKAIVMNHFLANGDGHLKNYGILYTDDFKNSYLAPIYDVITTTLYIKKDIPALRLSDGKLWWKEKTYKNFAKQSCGLSNKEYQLILKECREAIIETKKEIKDYNSNDKEVRVFLNTLQEHWCESLV